jgi:hypothetical protein
MTFYCIVRDYYDDFDTVFYSRINICRINSGTATILQTTTEGQDAGYTFFKLEVSGTGATVTLTLKGSATLTGTYTAIGSPYSDTSASRITSANNLGIAGKGGIPNTITEWAGGDL